MRECEKDYQKNTKYKIKTQDRPDRRTGHDKWTSVPSVLATIYISPFVLSVV